MVWVLLLLLGFGAEARAAGLVVTGRVHGPDERPVLQAEVHVFSGHQELTLVPEATDLHGDFRFSLPGVDVTHVQCELRARGYVPMLITVPVKNGQADLGTVVLKPRKSLRIATVKYSQSALDDYFHADVQFHNETQEVQIITELALFGQKLERTGCLDVSPAFIVRFDHALDGAKGAASVTNRVELVNADGKPLDTLRIEGTLESLPCEQARLRLRVPLSLRLAPGEWSHLQVRIPQTMTVAGGAHDRLELARWHQFVLSMTLADGTTVMTEPGPPA
ncbi:hypothetical protein [Pyxidicoccus xibeiensis]|uniref:hypothetical protein n=1 Tax=Pyxidicoccus xibeiensis TaxID=2906759 RepID=UPI0020A79443|nr:hypothetical protein [Pyxidicoccus xibeiensis]MCP3143826.1 hypothetical protein [Pyxidicoccus xibeiensis]